MNGVTDLVRAELAEQAEKAALAVFTVSLHHRAEVISYFLDTFAAGVEAKEVQEQIEIMEGEGCPNGRD